MLRSTLLLLALSVPAAAIAEDFDYTYLSLGYGMIELDDVDVDGDGFGLDGSFAINDDFHVFANYQMAGLDFGVDATQFGAGFGYNTELSPVVDAFARLSYEYVELDGPGGSIDDNGLGFGVGLRFAATPKLELNAIIQYVDLSDSGDDTGFGIGGLYSITDNFAIGLGGDWSDDASSYTLSGRLYFGQ